jgi:hypothetical protein
MTTVGVAWTMVVVGLAALGMLCLRTPDKESFGWRVFFGAMFLAGAGTVILVVKTHYAPIAAKRSSAVIIAPIAGSPLWARIDEVHAVYGGRRLPILIVDGKMVLP